MRQFYEYSSIGRSILKIVEIPDLELPSELFDPGVWLGKKLFHGKHFYRTRYDERELIFEGVEWTLNSFGPSMDYAAIFSLNQIFKYIPKNGTFDD